MMARFGLNFRLRRKYRLEKHIPTELLASAISLPPDKIITDMGHPPQIVSVGLPFLIAELEDKSALERASVNLEGFNKLAGQGITPDIHIYTRSNDEFDIRARMFA